MNQINNQNQEIAMVEEVKTSVEPKNEKKMKKRNGEKTLKAQLKEAKKTLEKLKKMNVADSVVNAQKAVVERLEKEENQSKAESKKVTGTYVDAEMTFEVWNEEKKKSDNIAKRIAFVKNNRPIDRKKVDAFMKLFSEGKYEKAYPIIAIEAKKLQEAEYVVTDVNAMKSQKKLTIIS